MDDPQRLTLVVAIIGVGGTITASVIGHVFALAREAKAWKRDQARQREIWAREDRKRLDERRHDSYIAYLNLAERAHSRCHLLWVEPLKRTKEEVDLVADVLEELATAQALVMVHGSRPIRSAAPDLYNAVAGLVNAIVNDPDDEDMIEELADNSLAEIRRFRNFVRVELRPEIEGGGH